MLRVSKFIYEHISKKLGLAIRGFILKHHKSSYFDDISIRYEERKEE